VIRLRPVTRATDDLGDDRLPEITEHRATVPVSGHPSGQRDGERELVGVDTAFTRDPCGQVDLGRTEHAGVGERPERPDLLGDEHTGAPHRTDGRSRAHDDLPPPNSRSSASTVAVGGRHANTPAGRPSWSVGVSGPIMPRTNR
jgi:hypothetical protein